MCSRRMRFYAKWTRWSAIPGARLTESGICGRPRLFNCAGRGNGDFLRTMLPVKAVRDAVVQTLMTWHDQFVAVSYVSEEGALCRVSDAVPSTGRLFTLDRGQ